MDAVKSWPLVVAIVVLCLLVVFVRSRVRAGVTAWMAQRLRGGPARARTTAWTWYGLSTLAVAALLGGGFALAQLDGPARHLRIVPSLAVLLIFVPVATLGAPKLTKWQKNFGRRLHEAGAAQEAAEAFARVARIFSVVGVLCGLAAVLLIGDHGA